MTKKEDVFVSEDPYLKWLRKTKGLSKTSVYHYYTYYKHFDKLNPTQNAINKFIQQRKNHSIVRGFMKSFLEFLGVEKQFKLPPKQTGTKKKRIVRNYTTHQIEQVRVYSYEKSLKDGLIFDIIYYGALRRAEITTIEVNHFDWSSFLGDISKHAKLLIFGKGKKQREVLIHPLVMMKLLDFYLNSRLINLEMNTNQIIDVLSSNISPLITGINEWKIWKLIHRNSERAIGIAMRPHELRHTRATELERNGASIRAIQHYLGHSNPQTTDIYLHHEKKESLEKIRNVVENI